MGPRTGRSRAGGPAETQTRGDGRSGLGVAGGVLLVFSVVAAVLRRVVPPTASEQAAADPYLATLQTGLGSWGVLAASAAVGLALLWWRRAPRGRLGRELALAAAGAAGAALAVVVVRLVVGQKLPAFIPPEESAAPGRVLGLEAGISEEALFRLCLLPAIFWGVSRLVRRPRWLPILATALAVGLLFALAHELPPAAGAFDARIFATRVVVPGVAMSLLFFWPGPGFVVGGHCAAHLVIPALFT